MVLKYIHIYISPLFFPCAQDEGDGTASLHRPGTERLRNGGASPWSKNHLKSDFGSVQDYPGRGHTGVSEAGAGGAESRGGAAALPGRSAVLCRDIPGCVRGQGRPRVSPEALGTLGGGTRGVPPPRCPLEEKDAFLCRLPSVLKMSSESLGGRGDRAQLSSTVTTIFFIGKNMIRQRGRLFFLIFFFLS